MTTVRPWIASAGIALAFAIAPFREAEAAEPAPARVILSIESQPVLQALRALGEQMSLQILFRSEGVATEDVTTPRVAGELSAQEALERLLARTGLKYEFVNERTVRISNADSPVTGMKASGPVADDSAGPGFMLAQLEDAEAPAGADPSAQSTAGLDEVVMTGSRLARTAFDLPTPVTVLSSAQIQQSGFNNIADVLTQLPAVGLGVSLSTGQFNGGAGDGDAGAAFANLRALGAARTLVLINGHRRVAGSTNSSAIDLSTIPPSMIERVELITGGASAVYGADAVSGVINVILKKNFSGLELSGQGGFAEHGGAGSSAATLADAGGRAADGQFARPAGRSAGLGGRHRVPEGYPHLQG